MPLAPPHLFRALRNRNYRLFFAGQGVSLIGTWITRIAASWLVYRLTDSALLLGLVGFFGQIPTLVLAPVAGVFIDRWDRHRVLLITQAQLRALLRPIYAERGLLVMPDADTGAKTL